MALGLCDPFVEVLETICGRNGEKLRTKSGANLFDSAEKPGISFADYI